MKRILSIAMLLAAVAVMASCGKEHQCKCVTTDVPDNGLLKLVFIDGGMSCDDITSMGFEVKYTDTVSNEHSLRHTEMHQVTCRDYND